MKKLTPCLFILYLILFFQACGNRTRLENLVHKSVAKTVDLRDMISQVGEVNPIVKVELKSESSGKIDTIYVKEGERLKKGQRILKIDPTQTLTQKKKLDLSKTKANLNYALAKRDVDNARILAKNGNISQRKLEDLENQLELMAIQVKEIKVELDDVNYMLSKTLIASPMEGVLISLLVEEGEIAVSATRGYTGGTAIGTVADISKLEIITQIGEVDYSKIELGQGVEISLESDAKAKTSGKVSFRSLSAKKEQNSNISNFEVRISIDSLITGLVPGVNVNVDFVVLDKKGVLGIPFNMVEKRKRNGREVFFVFRPQGTQVDNQQPLPPMEKKKRARRGHWGSDARMDKRMRKKIEERSAAIKKLNLVRQRIKVGDTDYRFYEVLEGLSPGDTVVKVLGEQTR